MEALSPRVRTVPRVPHSSSPSSRWLLRRRAHPRKSFRRHGRQTQWLRGFSSLEAGDHHGLSPPTSRVGYLSRKALPIKRADAEPLTREDVQYDLLHHIFSNPKAVFTSATPGKTKKVTFSELYVAALSNSNKCSKVLKDKMKETPAFALELAKISLLTNVGRINTTMACEIVHYQLWRGDQSDVSETSFPGNEDGIENIPPSSLPPENRRQRAGCPED